MNHDKLWTENSHESLTDRRLYYDVKVFTRRHLREHITQVIHWGERFLISQFSLHTVLETVVDWDVDLPVKFVCDDVIKRRRFRVLDGFLEGMDRCGVCDFDREYAIFIKYAAVELQVKCGRHEMGTLKTTLKANKRLQPRGNVDTYRSRGE
jgi:hypothetical protein